jgi:hypothetical protein
MTAVEFLTTAREGLARIIQENPRGWYFGNIVQNWDSEHGCGKRCCLEGWLPAIFPQIRWEQAYPGIRIRVDGEPFTPQRLGVQMSPNFWRAITGPYRQVHLGEPILGANCTYAEFDAFLGRVIERIKSGDLDPTK